MRQSQIQINEGQLYTTREVQGWLKISRTTLWRYQKQGLLNPVRLRRDLRFRGTDLIQLMLQAGGGDGSK